MEGGYIGLLITIMAQKLWVLIFSFDGLASNYYCSINNFNKYTIGNLIIIIYLIFVNVSHSYSLISGGQTNTPSTPTSADFQPDRPIGYGAFGVVWSVTDPRDGKRVALKKLPNVFQSIVSSKR